MKRWIWLPVVLTALGLLSRLPHPAADIGELEPVSLVRISNTGTGVKIETDTGAMGYGPDLMAAQKDLHDSTGAEVFLETADILLLPPEGEIPAAELLAFLRPSVRVCFAEGELDLKEAEAYLAVHKPAATLYGLQAGDDSIEVLTMNEGRGVLEFP